MKFKKKINTDYVFNHFKISFNVIFLPYNRIAVLNILPDNFIIPQQQMIKSNVVNIISILSTVPVPNLRIIIKGVIGGK